MIYLRLFNGRLDPTEEMQDWGTNGPTLRLTGLHVTYLNILHVRGTEPDADFDDLETRDGCVFYDGVFYGDWCILDPSQEPVSNPVDLDWSKTRMGDR